MSTNLRELTEKRDAILAETMIIVGKIAAAKETHMRAEGLAATLGKEDTPAAARGVLAALNEAKGAMAEINVLRSKLEPIRRTLNKLQEQIRDELSGHIKARRKIALDAIHGLFNRCREIELALAVELDALGDEYGIELPSYSKILGLVTSARPA